MASGRLWTFGHSTRTADETVELLRSGQIGRVVDVRSIPGSRRNPQFGAETMAGWLDEAGIDYRRIERLGGRRRRQPVDPEVNAGWTHDAFHRYADWTLTDEFEQGLAELTDVAGMAGATGVADPVGMASVAEPGDRALPDPDAPGDRRTAIMCAEAVPWRCHRSLIATVLVLRGWQVEHILGPGQVNDHRPGQWGPEPVVRPDGKVVYPRPGTPPLFD